MRTTPITILLVVLASMVAGCRAASDQPESDAADMSWIFETPADPIQVAVTLDSDKAVEALIPVEGGALSATGADGTVYTLEIPSGALLNETTISLTPVGSIAGMPFGGEQTYAVQLGPEGLFLYDIAILTITPAEDLPLSEQIVFGYLEDGKDLILAAPVVDSNEIKIQVLHFSGNGVTKGLLADIEPVRHRLGGTAERIMENAVSIELALTRQGADGEARRDLFSDAFREYEEQVVKPRVAEAVESCAAGRLAEQTLLRLDLMRQALGFSEVSQNYYPALLDTVAQVCMAEEYDLCVDQHIIHRMIPALVYFKYRYAMMGLPADHVVLRLAEGLTEKCLTFKLQFDSSATFVDEGFVLWVSAVNSEITLRFNADDFTIRGRGPLINEDFEFFMPGCDVTSVTGDGTFEAHNLEIMAEPGTEEQYPYGSGDEDLGQVGDFTLHYTPGPTGESYSWFCGDEDSGSVPPSPVWTFSFIVTRLDEVDAGSPDGGRFIAADWEILSNQYFAKKEWVTEYDVVDESGAFELYHTPGG